MEVPDWGDAPGGDYPAFDSPAELPASVNAKKKAKRKRKQQEEQQETLLNVPVRLSTQSDSGETKVSLLLLQLPVAI